MKHVMIDLETLGRCVGCVVLTAAAVEFVFDVRLDELVMKETGKARPGNILVKSIQRGFPILEQVLDGAYIETDTLEWWQNQSANAKSALMNVTPSSSVGEALNDLFEFIHKDCSREEIVIWAQGTDFDIAMLRRLFVRYLGASYIPWVHTNIRDSRSYIYMAGELLKVEDPYALIPEYPSMITHQAVHDAERSAYNVAYLHALLHRTIAEKNTFLVDD